MSTTILVTTLFFTVTIALIISIKLYKSNKLHKEKHAENIHLKSELHKMSRLLEKRDAEVTQLNSELIEKNEHFEEKKYELAEISINLLEKNELIEEQKLKLSQINEELTKKSELLQDQQFKLAEANLDLLEMNEIIKNEREKSERLLLNILPIKIVNDLKEYGKTEPEKFENVTVYFSDLVGFTKMSSSLEPKVLINELNNLFTAFDNIIEKNHCERIKTIGDAYLCVCGMPEENKNHAENIIQSAIDIIYYLAERNRKSPIQWQMRIGIHSGQVVGGVVGLKKYIYDVFGDTINTASRMESLSEPMKINISEITYNHVKDKFIFKSRGLIDVKGKGKMKMFFVETPF